MTYSEIVNHLAQEIYEQLAIPANIYRNFDLESAQDFKHQYLDNTAYLRSMVADELYDSEYTNEAELSPKDYELLLDDVVDEVTSMLEDVLDKFRKFQRADTMFTFHELLQVINSDLLADPVCSVIDVKVEDVGDKQFPEYEINLVLDNNAIIHMKVDFEEDYDNI